MLNRKSIRHLMVAITAPVIAGGVLLIPNAAYAHSELVSSSPAANETLKQAPDQVTLRFNEGVQEQGGTITVTGEDGARYDDANTFRSAGTEAEVELVELAGSGLYTVAYRVVSADGHVVEGDYDFRLKIAGTGSATPTVTPDQSTTTPTPSISSAAEQEEDNNGSAIWVLGLGAIGLALVAAMVAVFARRGRD